MLLMLVQLNTLIVCKFSGCKTGTAAANWASYRSVATMECKLALWAGQPWLACMHTCMHAWAHHDEKRLPGRKTVFSFAGPLMPSTT